MTAVTSPERCVCGSRMTLETDGNGRVRAYCARCSNVPPSSSVWTERRLAELLAALSDRGALGRLLRTVIRERDAAVSALRASQREVLALSTALDAKRERRGRSQCATCGALFDRLTLHGRPRKYC